MFQEYAKREKLINMNKVINIQTENIFDKYVDRKENNYTNQSSTIK